MVLVFKDLYNKSAFLLHLDNLLTPMKEQFKVYEK